MKKIALAVSALLMGSMSASAADLAARPYTKAPALVSVYDWSGFYIGVNGGGGSSHKCWDFTTPAGAFVVAEGCHDSTGGTVGGQVGYRWQAANWVFGLEAQGNWADFRGSNTSNNGFFGAPYTNRSRIDAVGLFTGQVGYAWNSFLLYVKGGAAVARDKYDIFLTAPQGPLPTGFIAARGSETRWGGVVGVGAEYGFTPNWSFALEYNN